MESLTGIVEKVLIVGSVIHPICHNSKAGEGNCLGMIRHKTCPAIRIGSGHKKFPECQGYINNQSICGD
jgi:hypothetical protein